MPHHVCPHWFGYFLAGPVRRRVHDPERILAPHVRPGMTVLDIGCAMGFFSLPAARMVGDAGRVVCVDLQPRMLATLAKRAHEAGLAARIATRTCAETTLGLADLAGTVNFALAVFMVHEVPDPARLFGELREALRPGARLLLAEPLVHVSARRFARNAEAARAQGFVVVGTPDFRRARAVLLEKARG